MTSPSSSSPVIIGVVGLRVAVVALVDVAFRLEDEDEDEDEDESEDEDEEDENKDEDADEEDAIF